MIEEEFPSPALRALALDDSNQTTFLAEFMEIVIILVLLDMMSRMKQKFVVWLVGAWGQCVLMMDEGFGLFDVILRRLDGVMVLFATIPDNTPN